MPKERFQEIDEAASTTTMGIERIAIQCLIWDRFLPLPVFPDITPSSGRHPRA